MLAKLSQKNFSP